MLANFHNYFTVVFFKKSATVAHHTLDVSLHYLAKLQI